MSNINNLESLNLILDQISGVFSSSGYQTGPIKTKGGVGVQLIYGKKCSTPPLETTIATLRSALAPIPRPFPVKTQVLATSLALLITRTQPRASLPVGSSPVLAQASELESRLDKAYRKAHLDAHFLLTQVGYRIVDISDATERLALSSLRLCRVLREYEGV